MQNVLALQDLATNRLVNTLIDAYSNVSAKAPTPNIVDLMEALFSPRCRLSMIFCFFSRAAFLDAATAALVGF